MSDPITSADTLAHISAITFETHSDRPPTAVVRFARDDTAPGRIAVPPVKLRDVNDILRKDLRIGDTVTLRYKMHGQMEIIAVVIERRPPEAAPYVFPQVPTAKPTAL